MTEGRISKKIIFFAIPLFLGNLFQQLYNTADSLIVGNFLGSNALAAVSSSGNLIFLMVGFINGTLEVKAEEMAKKYDCPFVDNEMPYGRVPQGHPVIVDYFYHEEIRETENIGKRNR